MTFDKMTESIMAWLYTAVFLLIYNGFFAALFVFVFNLSTVGTLIGLWLSINCIFFWTVYIDRRSQNG